jgi:hypothetical protein
MKIEPVAERNPEGVGRVRSHGQLSRWVVKYDNRRPSPDVHVEEESCFVLLLRRQLTCSDGDRENRVALRDACEQLPAIPWPCRYAFPPCLSIHRCTFSPVSSLCTATGSLALTWMMAPSPLA